MQALGASGIELDKERVQKGLVVSAALKVAAAAQEERLLQRLLETPVPLLDIAVLIAMSGLSFESLQPIVSEQSLVAAGELLRTLHLDGGAQAVGAMLFGHASEFPQRVLQSLAETGKTLGEADRAGLPVGVGEHKVIEHVLEGLSCKGDAQAAHVSKVGSPQFTGSVFLREEDLLVGSLRWLASA